MNEKSGWLVYRFYVNQYWEIRLPYAGRVCNMANNEEHWILTLGYNWLLNNVEVRVPTTLEVKNPHMTFDSCCPSVSTQEIGFRTSTDTKIPYIKWRRTMHAIGPPRAWISKCWLKILFLIRNLLNLWMHIPGT